MVARQSSLGGAIVFTMPIGYQTNVTPMLNLSGKAAYHLAYGRHSGIPDCCIRFWLTEWETEMTQRTTYARLVRRASRGYVPCPKCLINKSFVQVRSCIGECGRECRDDFKRRYL